MLFPQAKDGKTPVMILDGGMGTTLQSYPVAQALDSNLWSSELLKTEEGRETLRHLHQSWVEAGADVVETCTYQSSLPLFLPRDGPYPQDLIDSSLSLMNSAIPLLTDHLSSTSTSSCRSKTHSALSLGPFGASLQPGQEYGGLYPPPFGPLRNPPTPSSIASGQSAFETVKLPLEIFTSQSQRRQEGEGDTKEVEDHLASWHLERLRQFSQSPSFDQLDVFAFETVPILYEARAIRRAVQQFRIEQQQGGGKKKKEVPYYISFVFPLVDTDLETERVRFPDDSIDRSTPFAEQCRLIVEATFGEMSYDHRSNEGGGGEKVVVRGADGIGFNCTSPKHSTKVVETLSQAYSRFISSSSHKSSPTSSSSSKEQEQQRSPFFVLYPDGGSIYSVETRTWSHPLGLTDSKWASIVIEGVEIARSSQVWEGVLVGGCCKAGPGAIRELRKQVEEKGWR